MRQNLCIYQGETYSFAFDALLDGAGDPIDLSTGYTAKMHIRENPLDDYIFAEFTDGAGLTLGADGVVTLDISSAETITYDWTSATYDIRLVDMTDTEYVYFGIITITPNVTREPGVFDPLITLPGTPQIITRIITDSNLVVGSIVAVNSSGNVSLADADGPFEAVGVSNGIYLIGATAEILMFHGTTAQVLMDAPPATNGVAVWLSNTPGTGTITQPTVGTLIKMGVLSGADGTTSVPEIVLMPQLATTGGAAPAVDYLDISGRDSGDPLFVYGGRTITMGALTSDPVWQIYRLQIITGEKIFAAGTETYDKVWDDRESLSYP